MKPLLFPILLTLFACRAARPAYPVPAIEVKTACGVVTASTQEQADRVAIMLEELSPLVRARLSTSKTNCPSVFFLDGPVGIAISGMATPSEILLSSEPNERVRATLTHELTHWYVDDAWKPLPHAAEEGLADLLAVEMNPQSSASIQVTALVALMACPVHDPIAAFELKDWAFSDLESAKRLQGITAIGFFVVSRIGVDGLRELCERAGNAGYEQVPAQWLLDRAGFANEDARQWKLSIEVEIPAGAKSITITTDN